jgi:ribosomal protein S18 acetylase RimI-like enzyme
VIRPTEPADTQSLVALAAKTDVFKPLELVALEEVLCDYFATNKALGHRAISFVVEGKIQGFAYFAPAAMTDRTWYLWWIAVTIDVQTRGVGSQMIAHVEQEIREQRGRVLLVETSSLAHYEPARKFYAKHGYAHEATLRGYYAAGDDMVVFSKQLS